MAQNIILKRSAVPGRVPDTGSINFGEVAINTYDGKLYFKKSGSVQSVETIVTTNSITSGSLQVSDDITIQRDLYVVRDVITDGDIDASGSLSGSGLSINDTLQITHNNFQLSGSANITGSLTVIGAINATQFNINIISSSVIFESGSSKFGNTADDIHQFTGSVSVTGSFLVNGSEVGVAAGPNTFDFNLDPNAAGTINYIEDSTSNTTISALQNSLDIKIGNLTYVSMSATEFNVTTGSVTANYYHLAKYINAEGDLDFN
jgi:hypothetical protein